MLLQFAWLLLTIGSGAATVLAYAPYRLFLLMPLCLAVLLWLVQRWPQRAFATAWLWGLPLTAASSTGSISACMTLPACLRHWQAA